MKCKHKNISITYKSYYHLPEGFEKAWNNPNLDLGKHFVEERMVDIFCEDCGKWLKDENDLN
ncbi:MAG: hypothetical protein ACTSR2_00825 [Candidatus Hodarchaeales archaeon]